MFEGPVMVVLWLMAPAFVGIGSFGAGLAFAAIPKLWQHTTKTIRIRMSAGPTAFWSPGIFRNGWTDDGSK